MSLFFLYSLSFASDPMKVAEDYLKIENYLKAKEIFQRNTENPSLAPQALLGLAKAEYGLGNYYEATVPLKRLLRDFKNSPQVNEANLYMGLSLLKVGRIKEAEEYLNKVQAPFEKKAMIGKAWIALGKGDLKTVDTILSTLDKKDFQDPEVALLRIKYLTLTGRANEALKEFNLNFKLKKPAYDLDKAEILYKAGKYEDAEATLKKFIERTTKLADVIRAKRLLFDIYQNQNKTEEAIKIGKEIYFYIPTDDFRLNLYNIYLNQKNYEEAIKMVFILRDKNLKNSKMEEFIKKVIGEAPEKAPIYISKIYPFLPPDSYLLIESANFLISNNNLKEAKNLLKKVQTGPRKAEAVLPYSHILIKEGKYEEAKKLLEPLKDKKPEALSLYAHILDKEGHKLSALQSLRKAEKSIKDTDTLVLLGNLEYSHGDRQKALKHWIKASQLGNSDASVKSADYFFLLGKTKEAVLYYKKAIDIGITDSNTLMWVYYQYGKITKDKTYLEKVAASKGELAEAAKAILEKL